MLEKYRTGRWDPMLRKYLQEWQLQQLPVPVNTVTTDLISAQSVARSTGDGVDSILESINLPVISTPICRDGMLLVDGGILNNLPADVLVNQGCNFVIGVDVAANIEYQVGDNLPDTPTKKMKSPNAVTTLLRCLRVQAHNMSSVGASRRITSLPRMSACSIRRPSLRLRRWRKSDIGQRWNHYLASGKSCTNWMANCSTSQRQHRRPK